VNPLKRHIAEMIAQDGPITLERYMELALGHPRYGYYMTRDPFGAAGDFITAPEISQMFGELLGLWAAETWLRMGSPKCVRLVELGPGRGTLMADALRAVRAVSDFVAALDVHLVETSPVLREAQRANLVQVGVPVTWHDDVDALPSGPAIVLANEFFDALPVRHYVMKEGAWRERLVGIDATGELAFGLAPDPEATMKAHAPEGAIKEVGVVAHDVMGRLAGRIAGQGGAALIIDYGYFEPCLGETLQALARHRPVDPLQAPGEADLTTHVSFAALAEVARKAGAHVPSPLTQAKFLQRLGIVARAERLKRNASEKQARDIDSALDRLTASAAPTDMGALFKVLAVGHPSLRALPAFEAEMESA
jgi:NADH dehydrogenase [ubiquinone] 1 alpha subcomplex assembly factor 7